MIEIIETSLREVLLIKRRRFGDHRGSFEELYNAKTYQRAGLTTNFVQDNYSISSQRGTLRGIHYQLEPNAQDKLVQVMRGRVFDVAIDLRQNSASFLQWVGVELSAENGYQLYIPKGFGHGFLTLEDECHFYYKLSAFYEPGSEASIIYNDPQLKIDWPISDKVILSHKDSKAPPLSQARIFS